MGREVVKKIVEIVTHALRVPTGMSYVYARSQAMKTMMKLQMIFKDVVI